MKKQKINSIKDIEEILFKSLKNDKEMQRVILKARKILGNNTLADFSRVFQREYARIIREVAKTQGNVPNDMKNLNDVRKLQTKLETRYNTYLNNINQQKF